MNYLSDTKLSWKAKGIMFYIHSKPSWWVVRQKDLIAKSSDGITSLRSALRELMERGYIERKIYRDKNGKFTSTYKIPRC